MATLDDITQERKRIAERLGRLDAEREKLAEELTELQSAERVLARLDQSRPARRKRGAGTEAATPKEPRRTRQRRTAPPVAQTVPSLSLGDATLRAVSALGNGASAEDVRTYLGQQWGMNVRPNHLGMALQRHRRAGRLEQRDSRWWSPETTANAFAAG
jgi:hypothetical protein